MIKSRIYNQIFLLLFISLLQFYVPSIIFSNDLMLFPENSGIPKRRWKYLRLNGKFMWKTLCEFEEKYNVQTLFCGNRVKAEERVADIFEETLERLDYEGQQ